MKKDGYTYVIQTRGNTEYKDRNYYRVKNDEITKIAFEKKKIRVNYCTYMISMEI